MIEPGTPPSIGSVDIIIPTMDNGLQLYQCLYSLIHGSSEKQAATITVINNGQPGYVGRILGDIKEVNVIEAGGNIGWEGGINLGAKKTSGAYILMLNDDTAIVPGNPDWLANMVRHLEEHPECAAIGPSSNMVAQKQSIFHPDQPLHAPSLGFKLGYTSLLIGFCLLVRRDVFEDLGGLAASLPGGDDLDLSIRIELAGWQLLLDRSCFVYHHGSQTGQRAFGAYWNSIEMQDRTKMELIRRHGLRPFIRCVNSVFQAIE